MNNNKIKEMLNTNAGQHEYYETASGHWESPINSSATNFWRRVRRNIFTVFRNAGIQEAIVRMHIQWIGDVSNAKVLDLGMGEGNPLSLKLANEAREYVAIDLSSARMEIFQRKLDEAGITGARAYIGDFLNEVEFPEADFDFVYALSVFHHFKHMDAFLDAVSRRMTPGGRVVTLDPLQTWFPIKLVRMAYRPFQTDSAWEFPFDKKSIDAIQKKFEVEHVQGIYGYSKWAVPISIFNPQAAKRYGYQWHKKDLQHANRVKAVNSCLRVSFLLRNNK